MGLIGVFFIGLIWYSFPHPLTPLLICTLPIALLVTAKIPFFMGMLFILFSFFRLHEALPFLMPFKLPFLLAFGTLYALAVNIALKRLKPFWDPLYLPFVLLFVHVTIGISFSTNPAESFAFWKNIYIKIAIMVFALSWVIRTEKQLVWAARLIALAAFVVALVALSNKAAGIELVEGTRVTVGRSIGSMLGDPNDLSLVLLFGAAFAFSLALGRFLSTSDRLLGLVVYFTIVLAIIATQSRGGLLGIAAVTGVVLSRRIQSKALLVGLGVIALLALFVVAGVSDRQSGGAHEEGIDESAMGRIYAWNAAFNMAIHNPITGVGVKNFFNNYFQYSEHWDGKNHAVHSTWFGVMAETGILGFILFIWMMAALILALRRARAELDNQKEVRPELKCITMALIAGFVGFCVSGTFLTQGYIWPIYIILALSVSLKRVAFQNDA